MFKSTFIWLLLALIALPGVSLSGQVSAEKYISDYLNSIRDNRALLTAFFQQMPKGGDLHNHFSGSIYAESYFDYALKADFWVNLKTLALYDKAPAPNEGIKRFSEVKAAGGVISNSGGTGYFSRCFYRFQCLGMDRFKYSYHSGTDRSQC